MTPNLWMGKLNHRQVASVAEWGIESRCPDSNSMALKTRGCWHPTAHTYNRLDIKEPKYLSSLWMDLMCSFTWL